MTRFALFAIVSGLAVGCGYSEDQYADDLSTAACDSITACEADIVAYYTDSGLDEATAKSTYDLTAGIWCAVADAVDEGEEVESDDSCDYDAGAAKECVADVEDMSCDGWTSGTGFPASCDTVCG